MKEVQEGTSVHEEEEEWLTYSIQSRQHNIKKRRPTSRLLRT